MRLLPPLLALIALTLLSGCTQPQSGMILSGDTIAGRALVVSASRPASEVGAQILRQGGNAVDAAVATAFALAVTFPEAGNLGGGGFMLIQPPGNADPTFIDYRESAPAAVNAKTFFKKEDRTDIRLVGVPGTVRGLALAHEKFGKLPWRDLLDPAVALAKGGYALDDDKVAALNRVLASSKDRIELQRVYSKSDGSPWRAGDVIKQPDLANTLTLLRDRGPDAFYTGPIADQLVAEMKRTGGLITPADLAAYRAKVRTPVRGIYRDYQIVSAPPPSSGGTAILEIFNILERFDLPKYDRFSPQTLHLVTEAMRRAYADRAQFLGDPDFVAAHPDLTSKLRAQKLAAGIDPRKATPSDALAPSDLPLRDEPENTTHFSVIDPTGMAVANTYTLEESFGGKIVVPGAGFLLNNELGDFNPQPGVTTRTGQIGTAPNLPAPNKRPLSSMTPTIVRKDGRVVLVTGSPGGRTIINTVACVLLNRLAYDMPPRESIDAPRHHHQWLPDRLQLEPKLHSDPTATEGLRALGHTIDPTPRRQGDAHSIFYDEAAQTYIGVADHRRSGTAAGY